MRILPVRQKHQTMPLGTYGPLNLRTLRLKKEELLGHWHIMGKTGTGKSFFTALFFVCLLELGFTATLLDPHAELSHLVLSVLAERGYFERPDAFTRLCYLDLPAASEARLFLPLHAFSDERLSIHERAQTVVSAMQRAWPDLSGGHAPEFERLALAGCHVLAANHLPLALLADVLTDKPWREHLMQQVEDRVVVDFFREYERWGVQERVRLTGSTLRRAFHLSYHPALRYSLGQTRSVLDYRAILERDVSLIVNLNLGNDASRSLLGSLMTVALEQAGRSRRPRDGVDALTPHFLIIDEFGEFVARSGAALGAILSQLRKRSVFLVAIHQDLQQVRDLLGALQNVDREVLFRGGRADAVAWAPVLFRVDPSQIKHEVADETAVGRTHPLFSPLSEQWESYVASVQSLRNREAYVRLSDNGSDRVWKVRTLTVPKPTVAPEYLAQIEAEYRRRYFRPKEQIERELAALRAAKPAAPPNGQVMGRTFSSGQSNGWARRAERLG